LGAAEEAADSVEAGGSEAVEEVEEGLGVVENQYMDNRDQTHQRVVRKEVVVVRKEVKNPKKKNRWQRQ
jgi:hypothetical protein